MSYLHLRLFISSGLGGTWSRATCSSVVHRMLHVHEEDALLLSLTVHYRVCLQYSPKEAAAGLV